MAIEKTKELIGHQKIVLMSLIRKNKNNKYWKDPKHGAKENEEGLNKKRIFLCPQEETIGITIVENLLK